MQLYLERRELSVARFIVPNSILIKNQIAHYYPEYRAKLTSPVVPGVSVLPLRTWHSPSADAGVIGFVGKEWLRKGLPMALEIAAKVRLVRPKLEFWVVGPEPKEVSHLFANWKGGYRLLGWRHDLEHLAQIDVLLHPARVEPYGMVIAEAMAARARVVVSDACGAAPEVKPDAGTVVSLNAPLEQWVQAVNVNLAMDLPPPEYSHSWGRVAKEYEVLYQLLS